MSPRRPRARLLLGSLAGLTAGIGYGAALALSRLTYDHGFTPAGLSLLRYGSLILVLGAWLAAKRRFRRLRPRVLGTMLLLGVFSFMITVFNLSSIVYIPVSLTTIVFYLHPALVVLATAALMRSRVNPVEFAAVAAAFCGLFIALEVSFTSLHPLGLGFAGASALTVAVMYVVSNRLLEATDFIEVTFYMAVSAAALSALTLVPEGGMAVPESFEGLALVVLVTVLFMIAITSMFLSIELVGSVPTSMLTNVEPLTAIAVAVTVLGEPLPAAVGFGAFIVVGAILLMQASRAQRGASESARTRIATPASKADHRRPARNAAAQLRAGRRGASAPLRPAPPRR